METKKMLKILFVVLGLMICPAQLCKAATIGTAFTYQGFLIDKGKPADGLYDFQFSLYDDPNTGIQQGSTIDINDLDVIDGYFAVELDFGGGIFTGYARWLEMAVRPGASSDPCDLVTLSPRLELTPTPYAIYASSTEDANKVDGYDAGNASSQIAISNGTVCTNLNADMLDGYHAGNSSGQVAVSNGTICANLNADTVDGQHGSYYRDWNNLTNVPGGFADNVDNTGITSESDTLDNVCSRGSSTSRSVTVSNTVYGNRFYVSDAGNDNGLRTANTSSSYPTIWAKNNGNGVAISGETGNSNTTYGINSSDYYPTIWARNQNSNGANCIYARSNSSSYPTLYVQQDGSDYAGWFDGDLGCSGSKPATVRTQNYGHRNLYSDESAEIYFFDRGHGQLTNGSCIISLDPMFLETVTINNSYPMLVQITLTADCKGVFVSEKTDASFTVTELQGGTSNATFDWEVATKRKGYEDIRMEKITIIEESQVETLGTGIESDQEGVSSPGGGVRIIKGE